MYNVDVTELLKITAVVGASVTLVPSMIGYVFRKMTNLMVGR